MSQYAATITWHRDDQAFLDNKYSRGHTWEFDGQVTVPASSSPHVVPLPMSVERAVDPEEAFVAAISSCHMLWFLSLAAKRKLIVDSYRDEAIGVMEKNADGQLAVTRVTLRPKVVFAAETPATNDLLTHLHHQSHELCFIANSVKTIITVQPSES
ncbi:MAG: OsmC family protein [Pirellulaceae bacterium]|nr:OsmC family protein [Planctomycetales bacterium]